ncbi:esterase/lipase family protein [Blastococcus sp. PRF04-17]|uniref:esterase/lipase family protein n=1 Tax=Blastococcus sp. PRF04-17 TaxID=2933797 RepID=UPI001FF6E479|nr:hypothetical protein [Blastococcus sp. PRF04-17]UOY03812.1 hypothetical protein MVA48_10985 [Blastococcus sp. PRF04-17]
MRAAADGPYLPIIYLRGFTYGQGGTEATVDDPFYGFNKGSTHVRQDETGQPAFYVFESPVLRLLSDHGYRDSYIAGVQAGLDAKGERELEKEQDRLDAGRSLRGAPPGPEDFTRQPATYPTQRLFRAGADEGVGLRSLWVYRYYDQASKTFPDTPGRRQEIEESALGLSDLIEHVKERTGAPRVNLVAHSTGGLVIRCLIQRTYPNLGRTAVDHVDKVFTYATPHGGIEFDVPGGGVIEWLRDRAGALFKQTNIDDFGPRRLWEITHDRKTLGRQPKPPRNWDSRELTGFPPERFFSMVGTNPGDYDNRLSANAVGAHSDGLVQIENAYVRGAPRAYAHRSHSGRYGIVNSEEGYQNLERFFFGDLRVHLELDRLDKIREDLARRAEKGDADGHFHHLDATVAVRGLPALMHNQQIQHHSAIPIEYRKLRDKEPIPLFTVFLLSGNRPAGKDSCLYTLRLRVQPVHLRDGVQRFDEHIEQAGTWEGLLDVETIKADGRWRIGWQWRWQEGERGEATPRGSDAVIEVPFPKSAREELGPRALLRLRASRWNDWNA